MPPFTRSETTSRLVRYLAAFDKGTSVTYGDLDRTIGETIDPHSHSLRSARQILQREHAQVWCVVSNIGLRRLTDLEIAERMRRWWLPGARRKLGRGQAQSAAVDTKNLSNDEQHRFAISGIQAELALQSLSKPTAQRLGKVATGSSNDLPSFNMLEWAITLMPRKRREEKP
jgi:hypothetical protein